jgi:uncharacterized SAM-binding protein YcdF (DUF218 family)
VLLVGAVVAALAARGFQELGGWLIVSDPLKPAHAVVVMRGGYPWRAQEAGAIYRQGWAPEIWLTRTRADVAGEALRRRGQRAGTEDEANQVLLQELSVPTTSVRLLGGTAANTAEEVKLVARELGRVGGGLVIIVTSKSHTRRVRDTWRAVVGERPAVVVRYASGDPFRAERWWRSPRDAFVVRRELFGLLRVWTGLPPSPRESQ